jgi:hypothetical protein
MAGRAGGHRVHQLLLDNCAGEEPGSDPPRLGLLSDPCVVRDHIGVPDQPGRLEGDQFGIARPDTHT